MKAVRLLVVYASFALSCSGVRAQSVMQYLATWENKQLSDSVRFFALDEVAWYYSQTKPDSGYILAQKQLTFLKGSEKKRWKWMLRALNNRSWSYNNVGNFASGIRDLQEMLKISEQKHFINGICTAQGVTWGLCTKVPGNTTWPLSTNTNALPLPKK
jgi:hypothetical protein